MDLKALAPTEDYVYTPLNSANFEIRLLHLPLQVDDLLGRATNAPLRGSLETYSLPLSKLSFGQRFMRSTQLPVFEALSYVWGDPTRTHEIVIDNKIIRITANLYGAIRDLLKDASWNTSIWADAICINQDDLDERSSQILLMREIYHCAADVRVWLGHSSNEGRKVMKFIADLTGEYGPDLEEAQSSEDGGFDEVLAKVVLLPTGHLLKRGYAFGQTVSEMVELFTATARDDKAKMIIDRVGDLSLHQDTIEKLVKWKPSAKDWTKCKNEDFGKIATWIDEYLIENCHWFARMWVVQEVGTAETASILFAGASLGLEKFLRGCCYLHYSLDSPLRNMRQLIGLEKIRQGWNESKRHPLRELIRECRYRKATDSRDKIFALLGLMGDKMNPFLQPDYTKSVSQVYANATFHFMTQSCSLNPICGWQRSGRLTELPSWVPDYSLDQEDAATPLVSIDGTENVFNACQGQMKVSIPLVEEATSSKYNWRQLRTTGLCLDSVALLSEMNPPNSSFGDTEKIWLTTIFGANEILPAFDEESKAILNNISEVVNNFNVFWNSIDDISHSTKPQGNGPEHSELTLVSSSSLKIDANQRSASAHGMNTHNTLRNIALFSQRSYVVEAYIYSLFSGKFSAEKRLTKDKIDFIFNFNIPTKLKDMKPQEVQDVMEMCGPFIIGMSKRRIAVTKSGYIGVLPEGAQIGDLVGVLSGCSVPVVLRRARGDVNSAGNAYTFVGECYLHGFMDGEAIVMQKQGTLATQQIDLF